MSEHGSGWVKPHRSRTVLELRQRIQEKESELQELRNEVYNIENGPRIEAVAKIRNIMRAQHLTLDDISAASPRLGKVQLASSGKP